MKKGFLNITVMAFALCCIIFSAHAQISPQTITKTFNVRPGGQLTLTSQLGAIDVKLNSGNQVSCVATKAVNPNNNVIIGGFTKAQLDRLLQEAFTDFEFTFEQKGSDVLIQGKFKRGLEYWQRQSQIMMYIMMKLNINFQVTVPRRYNVDLKTGSSGNIRTENIGGKLKAESDYGDIELGSVTGAVNAKTGSNGNIILKACQSTVEAESDYGNIELGNVTGAVNAKTGSNGNITLKACQSTIEAKTDYGDIELGNVTGAVNAKTGSNGNIRAENIGGKLKAESDYGDIELGNVTGAVNAKTGSNGNITLKACQSTIEAKTDYGDIELSNVTGAVNAKTGSNGNITLKACQSTIEAKTDYGDIRSEITKQMTHPWTLQTSSNGEIIVRLLPNVAIDVDARTSSSGSVSSDFRIRGSISENSIKGTINGGGPLLKMRTDYGDIYLRKR